MSEGIGDLDGPLGRAVMHAVELYREGGSVLAESLCNLCEKAFAVKLPALAVVMKAEIDGRSVPVTVIVRLCAPCRAEIEAASEEVQE